MVQVGLADLVLVRQAEVHKARGGERKVQVADRRDQVAEHKDRVVERKVRGEALRVRVATMYRVRTRVPSVSRAPVVPTTPSEIAGTAIVWTRRMAQGVVTSTIS